MAMFSLVECYQEGKVTEGLDGQTGTITATAVLRCRWADRLLLADDVLLNRRAYPYITSAFTPKALNCAIVGAGGAITVTGQGGVPASALVTVNYGIPSTRQVGSFDIVAESIEPYGEFIRLDYSLFRWGSRSGDPITPQEAPGKFITKCKIVRKLYRIPTIPAIAMTAYGKCNEGAYASPLLGVTFPVETLLYDAPSIERSITSSGTDGYNYTQNWVYNPQGWNRYFRESTGTYDYIFRADTTGASVRWNSYEPTNFSSLLL